MIIRCSSVFHVDNMFDNLVQLVGADSGLYLYNRHANPSTLTTYSLIQQFKAGKTVAIVPLQSTKNHVTGLLNKCSINFTKLEEDNQLKFQDLHYLPDSLPDLIKLFDEVVKQDVLLIDGIHVLLALGCELADVVKLVQKLLLKGCVVIATCRVGMETQEIISGLSYMFEHVTTIDTLESGSSKEVDGHITYLDRSKKCEIKMLYKSSEKNIKLFTMGSAPGTF